MVRAEGRTFPFAGPESVDASVLETFAYEYAGREAEVVIATDEWSCVCPFSGLPDFGTLRILYVPDRECVELKSLKYYLTGYRNVGIYQEHAVQKVADDLAAACRPVRLEVALDYRLRGGLHTVVTARRP